MCIRDSFHWIRLHYLYPDLVTDELIDVMAENDKILNYLDIPIPVSYTHLDVYKRQLCDGL